jgi:hypothetical protein
MASFIRLILMLGVVAAVIALASWGIALHRVDVVLGDPPPQMGSQTTTFLWDGMPQVDGHPRVWRFAFGPTRIPQARDVRIYVSPLGRIVQTEPADLVARVKVFHATGY